VLLLEVRVVSRLVLVGHLVGAVSPLQRYHQAACSGRVRNLARSP